MRIAGEATADKVVFNRQSACVFWYDMIKSCISFVEHRATVCATPAPLQEDLISEPKLQLTLRNQDRFVDLMTIQNKTQAMRTSAPQDQVTDLQMPQIQRFARKYQQAILLAPPKNLKLALR